jgi:hypothetical protein
MRMGPRIRTYGFLAYWIVWCLVTMRQGQYPGLENLSRWHYPVWGVISVSALIGIFIGILYLILRPATYHRSWRRLFAAIAYSGALVALGIVTLVADMPGHAYVPAMFAIVNMALLLLFAKIQAGIALAA